MLLGVAPLVEMLAFSQDAANLTLAEVCVLGNEAGAVSNLCSQLLLHTENELAKWKHLRAGNLVLYCAEGQAQSDCCCVTESGLKLSIFTQIPCQ